MRSGLIILLSVLCLFPAAAGGADEGSSSAEGPLEIFVSIMPQKYLVQAIAGDRAEVSVMLPPGKSPATYDPSPRQVMAAGNADIFFAIGVNFEKAVLPVLRSNVPNLPVIDLSEKLNKRTIEDHTHGDEDHEEEEEEEDEEEISPDPHVWMSPVMMLQMADQVLQELSTRFPRYSQEFSTRYDVLKIELNSLHNELQDQLQPYKGRTFLVYHPAFGYFAQEYGLRQMAVETGGKEPTPKTLNKIINLAREEGIHAVFVQPEFPKASAEAVAAAIDGTVIPVEPLREEYQENMRYMARQLTLAFKGN